MHSPFLPLSWLKDLPPTQVQIRAINSDVVYGARQLWLIWILPERCATSSTARYTLSPTYYAVQILLSSSSAKPLFLAMRNSVPLPPHPLRLAMQRVQVVFLLHTTTALGRPESRPFLSNGEYYMSQIIYKGAPRCRNVVHLRTHAIIGKAVLHVSGCGDAPYRCRLPTPAVAPIPGGTRFAALRPGLDIELQERHL
jgi:hypothetical protein